VSIGGLAWSNRMRMTGMSSGLDIDEMVKQMMTAERIPLDRLLQKKQLLQWKQEDLRRIGEKISAFDAGSFALRLSTTFYPHTVSSSNESLLTAKTAAGAGVREGTHTLVVNNLAKGVHMASGSPITKAGGSLATLADQFDLADPHQIIELTITTTGAGGGASVNFSFDPQTDNIYNVVAAINQSALDIQAFYDSTLDRLFINSKKTGAATSICIYHDPSGFLSALKLQCGGSEVTAGTAYSGQNASVVFNGIGLEFQSNQFTLDNVTYTLHGANPQAEVVVQVSHDIDAVIGAIKEFVAEYNQLITEIDNELREKRYYDYPPLTAAQKEEMTEKEIILWEERARSGMLRADPILRQALMDIRQALTDAVAGINSPYNSLASIGISTTSWHDQGRLEVNETRLRQVLESAPEAVETLFTRKGSGSAAGLGYRLDAVLNRVIGTIKSHAGSITSAVDQSYLGRQLKAMEDDIETWESRLVRREEHYYRQFTALESFIASMSAQSSWLAMQFGGNNQ